MGKNPAFQFYPGDWYREHGLNSVSLAARGAWAECLFSMHDSVPRGTISGTLESFARFWRIEAFPRLPDAYETREPSAYEIIIELYGAGICDLKFPSDDPESEKIMMEGLPKGTANKSIYEGENHEIVHAGNIYVTIINRRMLREYNDLNKTAVRVRRYREKHKPENIRNANVTPPSNANVTPVKRKSNVSSSSSSSISSSSSPSGVSPPTPHEPISAETKSEMVSEFGLESCRYYEKVCRDYILASGKKYKSFPAFMRNWIRRDKAEKKGFYAPEKGGYKPHTAANTFEKNLEFLRETEGELDDAEISLEEVFELAISHQKKPSLVAPAPRSMVPALKGGK